MFEIFLAIIIPVCFGVAYVTIEINRINNQTKSINAILDSLSK